MLFLYAIYALSFVAGYSHTSHTILIGRSQDGISNRSSAGYSLSTGDSARLLKRASGDGNKRRKITPDNSPSAGAARPGSDPADRGRSLGRAKNANERGRSSARSDNSPQPATSRSSLSSGSGSPKPNIPQERGRSPVRADSASERGTSLIRSSSSPPALVKSSSQSSGSRSPKSRSSTAAGQINPGLQAGAPAEGFGPPLGLARLKIGAGPNRDGNGAHSPAESQSSSPRGRSPRVGLQSARSQGPSRRERIPGAEVQPASPRPPHPPGRQPYSPATQKAREENWIAKGKWLKGRRPFDGQPHGMRGDYVTYKTPPPTPPKRSESPFSENGDRDAQLAQALHDQYMSENTATQSLTLGRNRIEELQSGFKSPKSPSSERRDYDARISQAVRDLNTSDVAGTHLSTLGWDPIQALQSIQTRPRSPIAKSSNASPTLSPSRQMDADSAMALALHNQYLSEGMGNRMSNLKWDPLRRSQSGLPRARSPSPMPRSPSPRAKSPSPRSGSVSPALSPSRQIDADAAMARALQESEYRRDMRPETQQLYRLPMSTSWLGSQSPTAGGPRIRTSAGDVPTSPFDNHGQPGGAPWTGAGSPNRPGSPRSPRSGPNTPGSTKRGGLDKGVHDAMDDLGW